MVSKKGYFNFVTAALFVFKIKSPMAAFAVRRGIGLVALGVFGHDFSSTPMLLSSSELMFETSKSAPARARNTSKRRDAMMMNINSSFLYTY
jgi:hypothetical protein